MTYKTTPTPNYKPARVTVEAHENLKKLCALLVKEKGWSDVSYIEAASYAINDLTIRIKRKQKRREQKTVTA